jgi:hypothetical protein
MQRLSAWARGIALGFFTLFILPLVGKVLDHMAENYGLYDREALPNIINAFVSLAEQTWLRVTALVLGGFVAGLWLDWLLRRLDRFRAETRENLGIEMTILAHDIDNALALSARFPIQDFSPRLMSAFIKARQVGLWTPDVSNYGPLNLVMDYLRHVGTLLSDGHFREAKRVALQRKEAFPRT